MDKCLIGIDVGTSGVKVLALAQSGQIIGSASRDYPLYLPQAGWTEQEPADWWQATVEALKQLLPKCGKHQIAAVGLSGQMHGMVALDKNMAVIRRAILWNDQRTKKQCDELTALAGGEKALLELTNNQMLTGYTAGKIRWLQQNEPENFARVKIFLNPKDYIRLCLTGQAVTDVSDASGTGFYDVKQNRWQEELLHKAGLAKELFPEVVESTAVSGFVSKKAAEQTGLPQAVPVSGGGGDAVISTTGLGLIRPGRIGITLGTSGVVAMGVPEFMPNPAGKLQVFRGNQPGSFTAMGVTLAAAGSYQWFADNLGQAEKAVAQTSGQSAFYLLDQAARTSPPGADGLIFLPYLTGERCPVHDDKARGAFIGLTSLHKKGHLARAVLEGVAFSLRQVYDLIVGNKQAWLEEGEIILAGGGAVSPLWRQIFADSFGLPVKTVYGSSEGGSFGAALVAGVTGQVWPDLAAATQLIKPQSQTLPDPAQAQVYAEAYATYQGLYPALKWTFG